MNRSINLNRWMVGNQSEPSPQHVRNKSANECPNPMFFSILCYASHQGINTDFCSSPIWKVWIWQWIWRFQFFVAQMFKINKWILKYRKCVREASNPISLRSLHRSSQRASEPILSSRPGPPGWPQSTSQSARLRCRSRVLNRPIHHRKSTWAKLS